MTVNQVIQRIKKLVLAHKQIRTFRKGLVSDFFADKTAKYPAACLQDLNGSISLASHAATLNYRLFLVDLVHVSAETNENEDDVLSDMLSIGLDLLSQFNFGLYDDWKISSDNNIEFIVEGDNDLHAGIVLDFSVQIIFPQNICQIPTNIIDYNPTDDSMKYIYDFKYTATGTEGTIIDVDEIKGKKILFITRGNAIIYKTSSLPASNEYTWDDVILQLGASTVNGEPFLILYRNY